MSEHLCVICQVEHFERKQACERCRVRLRNDLGDIVRLCADLPAALEIGTAAAGPRVSGTSEPRAPLDIGVLDLSMPARAASRALMARGALGLDSDQGGTLSAATVLDTVARDWASALRHRLPDPTVPALAAWLDVRLEWACNHHPGVDEDAADIRQLRSHLRGALGLSTPPPVLLTAPCRRCDQRTLHRVAGDDRVHCGDPDCQLIMTADEYERWMRELADQLRAVA